MVDSLTIIFALISGLVGSLIGAIISSYSSYKFNIELSKKQLILKEKVKEYEAIEDKINQLHEIYIRFIEKEEHSKIDEILNTMERVLEYFIKFTPIRELYVPSKIRTLISNYYNSIKENSKKQKFSEKEILNLTKEFKSYTDLIRKEIEKELGLRR